MGGDAKMRIPLDSHDDCGHEPNSFPEDRFRPPAHAYADGPQTLVALAHEHGCHTIVDAETSLGGVPVQADL